MSEPREKMKPYLNKRVTVRGTLAGFDTTWKTGHRYTGRACITSPEIDAEVVCGHASVVDVPHWKEQKKAIGSQVTFNAVVQSYVDKHGQTSYCFANASELTLLHQPPALSIPDLPKEEEMLEEIVDTALDECDDPPAVITQTNDSLMDKIRQAKAFAKVCGGYDRAEEIVLAIPQMPMAEMLDYLRALKD
jgi:hypothetical protein